MTEGVELKVSGDKGEGVFATRKFSRNDIVVIGIVSEVLSENDSHATLIGENTYVRYAGLISKVNHSCEPNCGIKANETGGQDIVAMRDININEEITYDYAMKNYRIEHFPKSCLCGSKICRGKVTGWGDLNISQKQLYAGFAATYLD